MLTLCSRRARPDRVRLPIRHRTHHSPLAASGRCAIAASSPSMGTPSWQATHAHSPCRYRNDDRFLRMVSGAFDSGSMLSTVIALRHASCIPSLGMFCLVFASTIGIHRSVFPDTNVAVVVLQTLAISRTYSHFGTSNRRTAFLLAPLICLVIVAIYCVAQTYASQPSSPIRSLLSGSCKSPLDCEAAAACLPARTTDRPVALRMSPISPFPFGLGSPRRPRTRIWSSTSRVSRPGGAVRTSHRMVKPGRGSVVPPMNTEFVDQ